MLISVLHAIFFIVVVPVGTNQGMQTTSTGFKAGEWNLADTVIMMKYECARILCPLIQAMQNYRTILKVAISIIMFCWKYTNIRWMLISYWVKYRFLLCYNQTIFSVSITLNSYYYYYVVFLIIFYVSHLFSSTSCWFWKVCSSQIPEDPQITNVNHLQIFTHFMWYIVHLEHFVWMYANFQLLFIFYLWHVSGTRLQWHVCFGERLRYLLV